MKPIPRGALLLALALSSLPALADDDELAKLRQRVEQLENLVRDLTATRESRPAAPAPAASAPAASAPAAAPVAAAPANGNGNGSGNGSDIGLRVQLHGDLQADARFYEGGRWPATAGGTRGTPDTFLLRRARPILDATVLDRIDFHLMPDFGNNTTALFDAWTEARILPEARIRLGKFKPPVGLEALQVDDVLFFSERSLANDLVPTRDVGLQIAGDVFGGKIQYAVGVFNGTPDGANGGDRAVGSGKDIDARLFLRPFKGDGPSALRGLGAGVSYTFGRPLGSATTSGLPSYVSTGQQTIFSYNTGAFADGVRRRISPQAYYYYGPVGLMAEYIASDSAVTRGTNHRNLENRGWEVSAGWVLTGEDATYEGVVPEHPAWHGGWGAFELVGRTAHLKLDTAAFAGTTALRLADPATNAYEVTDYGIGVNWFLTRLVRVNLSYDKNRFKGSTGFNRPDEQVVIGRFQVAF